MNTASAPIFDPATPVRIELGGETVWSAVETWGDAADALVARHPGAGAPKVENCARFLKPAPTLATAVAAAVTAPAFSQFGNGKQIVDATAKTRIEATHAALIAGGVKVDAGEQLFSTGTRMMREGYATQAARKAEHDAQKPLHEVVDALLGTVAAEKREDREVTAGELADALHVNGKVTAFGLALTEQAIRGLINRVESPALGYVLGLRDRIAADPKNGQADRAQLAEVLHHECKRSPGTVLKLRTRATNGDIYACLSPGYASADAPAVVGQVLRDLPRDARGSYAYDPTSTTWELRLAVWTPTPVDEQAVGEAFEGYVSFYSRDNGTSKFNAGGGAMLLRCLNASTYTAGGSDVARVHRGRILIDIRKALKGATAAVSVLCQAWGKNREIPVDVPSGLTINDAIPGFWRYLLRDRSSEFARVLPGRTEDHVKGLTAAFVGERRNERELVRSDFAQGWTRYIQGQDTPVRRDAEAAVGNWLVKPSKIGHDAKA